MWELASTYFARNTSKHQLRSFQLRGRSFSFFKKKPVASECLFPSNSVLFRLTVGFPVLQNALWSSGMLLGAALPVAGVLSVYFVRTKQLCWSCCAYYAALMVGIVVVFPVVMEVVAVVMQAYHIPQTKARTPQFCFLFGALLILGIIVMVRNPGYETECLARSSPAKTLRKHRSTQEDGGYTGFGLEGESIFSSAHENERQQALCEASDERTFEEYISAFDGVLPSPQLQAAVRADSLLWRGDTAGVSTELLNSFSTPYLSASRW